MVYEDYHGMIVEYIIKRVEVVRNFLIEQFFPELMSVTRISSFLGENTDSVGNSR